MRVLLINPPWMLENRRNAWRNVASVMPSLGLAWIAAVLEKEGHAVKILDATAERLSVDAVADRVRQDGPFAIVGITATTPLIGNALSIARRLKSERSAGQVVLGGVHPTVLPAECLSDASVDVVVRGEGEYTLRDLVQEKDLHEIPGISFRRDGSVVDNPDRALIADLDSLPFPAYHLLPMSKYRPAAGATRRFPAASMLATRGCPGRCTFCYRIYGNRLRCRSGSNVAEEAMLLQDRYKIKEICFYDDTFPSVRREMRAFCKALREMRLDLTWSCFSRAEAFDEETFGMMKEAGCHTVMIGVESCDPDVLKNIRKNIKPEEVEYAISGMRKIGLEVRATFMLGSPGDTEESLEENIRYALRLNPDIAQFNVTTPYPGTEMFRWAQQNNFLRTTDWSQYDLSTPVMELPTVPSRKVLDCYLTSHRRFCLRPRFVWRQIRRLYDTKDFNSVLRGVRMLLGV